MKDLLAELEGKQRPGPKLKAVSAWLRQKWGGEVIRAEFPFWAESKSGPFLYLAVTKEGLVVQKIDEQGKVIDEELIEFVSEKFSFVKASKFGNAAWRNFEATLLQKLL